MKFNSLKKAVVVGAMAFASHAFAAPFSFIQTAGFISGSLESVSTSFLTYDAPLLPGGVGNNPSVNSYGKMSWGQGVAAGPKSALRVTTQSGALTVGSWTTISSLFHDNNVITHSGSWAGQDIIGRFQVINSVGGVVEVDNEAINVVDFKETPNTGTCAAPNPIGTKCDDYFSFTAVGSFAPILFNADGKSWKVSFDLKPISAVLDVPTDRYFTGEKATSQIDIVAMLEEIPTDVPEPATLGLFGLALVALGMVNGRKQNA
jgi:hypothetical protein